MPPVLRLLVEGQRHNGRRRGGGKRWSMEEKTLAMSLYARSPGSYMFLRKDVSLPSCSTLKRHIRKVALDVGI